MLKGLENEPVMDAVIKTVTFICPRASNHRDFVALLEEV
jgi:hypothetical protein